MIGNRIGKAEKIAALQKVVDEAELRARPMRIPFDRSRLPGRKRDLFIVARHLCPELSKASEASLEEYMRALQCKFPPATADLAYFDTYRRIFPECFSTC